ncbi:transmembrane protein 245 isoform X3 [Bradysia coprophila]|uniref:transmembrane protein 245 isoform X3 n=1 Tax=Bradysia coprophila TaxID=38358 RepID=UPI00187DCBE3|nr:transmembrane protein 245 isoform X3 [Bradysia coprophila]
MTNSPGFKKASESLHQIWWNFKNTNQLKGAVYNLVIVIVVCAILAVCFVLGPFLKPLLWSFLIGAVLFPFKSTLSSCLKRWFERLEQNDRHLLVGVALAPLEGLETFGEYLTRMFIRHMQMIVGGGIGLLLLSLFIAYVPKGFFITLWRFIQCGHMLFTKTLSSIDYTIVLAVVIVYLTVLAFLWKKENSFYFVVLGQTLWVVIVAYICSFLGAFQIPVFVASIIYAIVGVVYDFKSRTTEDDSSIVEKIVNFVNVQSAYKSPISSPVAPPSSSRSELISEQDGTVDLPKTKIHLNVQTTAPPNDDDDKSQSEIYFKGLFLASIVTMIYKHTWMLFVAFVPIFVYLTKRFALAFGLEHVVTEKWTELTSGIKNWINVRYSAILPLCLPGVLRLNNKIHKTVRNTMRDSIDTASSILVIILLILIAIFAGIFCAVEIYSETITVVQLGNDVLNWTYHHQPELMGMFPAGVTESLDNVIENAYQYGRTGIESYVDELLKDADVEQKKHLKDQLLGIWDRLIQYWVDRQKNNSFHGPTVPASAISDSIGEIVNNEELFSVAQQGLIGWVKINIGTLMELMDSVWLIVKTNLNILTSFVGTLLSMFLGGGQAVITFLVNAIIFLTALFYLLSSSEDKYAPMAATSFLGFSSSGPRIAEAIEASISSVLFASAKLALFHGMFTWLTHTIFGARVVFLPSVFASVLAAVPFLGTYWCSIPAFLDLWLIQDRFTLGIILLLIHILFPTSFVDPAIYADVKGGGHAYLTGLSIAGGMYWLGWEGAIFGPILLCLLVVIFNLTSNALKESPSTPSLRNAPSDFRVTDRRHSSFQNPF